MMLAAEIVNGSAIVLISVAGVSTLLLHLVSAEDRCTLVW